MRLLTIKIGLLLVMITSCNSSTDKKKKTSTSIESKKESVIEIDNINVDNNFDSIDFSAYIKSELKNESQILNRKGFKDSIVYLGDITAENGKVFYILNLYNEVPAAMTIHGHSIIFILDSNKKVVKRTELGNPDELPFKIENNSLYFHYRDSKTDKIKTFINKIENEIPKFICVEPDNCY